MVSTVVNGFFRNYILYFAWADQRDKVYLIFHKVARVLYGKYSTVMQMIVLGVKFLSVTTVTTDFKLNPLLTL